MSEKSLVSQIFSKTFVPFVVALTLLVVLFAGFFIFSGQLTKNIPTLVHFVQGNIRKGETAPRIAASFIAADIAGDILDALQYLPQERRRTYTREKVFRETVEHVQHPALWLNRRLSMVQVFLDGGQQIDERTQSLKFRVCLKGGDPPKESFPLYSEEGIRQYATTYQQDAVSGARNIYQEYSVRLPVGPLPGGDEKKLYVLSPPILGEEREKNWYKILEEELGKMNEFADRCSDQSLLPHLEKHLLSIENRLRPQSTELAAKTGAIREKARSRYLLFSLSEVLAGGDESLEKGIILHARDPEHIMEALDLFKKQIIARTDISSRYRAMQHLGSSGYWTQPERERIKIVESWIAEILNGGKGKPSAKEKDQLHVTISRPMLGKEYVVLTMDNLSGAPLYDQTITIQIRDRATEKILGNREVVFDEIPSGSSERFLYMQGEEAKWFFSPSKFEIIVLEE